MHIGLIGGIGPAATEHYYRGLIERHGRSGAALELTILHTDVRELSRNAATLARQKAGEGIRGFDPTSGRRRRTIRRRNLDGRSFLHRRACAFVHRCRCSTPMETGLHGGISSATIVAPEGDPLERVHRSYIEMAQAGRVTEDQRQTFFAAGEWMHRELGAEAILLGGTDLYLAFAGQNCGFPVLDCAAIHIDAIHDRAVGQ